MSLPNGRETAEDAKAPQRTQKREAGAHAAVFSAFFAVLGELGGHKKNGDVDELCHVLPKYKCSQVKDLQIIMAGFPVDGRPDPSMKRGSFGDATSSAIEVYVHKRVADCGREKGVFDLP
jgi:hypothetical protein